jgi:hypothetical protein
MSQRDLSTNKNGSRDDDILVVYDSQPATHHIQSRVASEPTAA